MKRMYLWWNLLTCQVSVTVGSSSLCLGGVFQVLINSLLVDLSGVELLKQYNVQLCDVQYNLRHAFLTIQFYHGLNVVLSWVWVKHVLQKCRFPAILS